MATIIAVVSLLALIAFFVYWLRKALLLPEADQYALRSQKQSASIEGLKFAFSPASANSVMLLPLNDDDHLEEKEVESQPFEKAVKAMIDNNFSEVLGGY